LISRSSVAEHRLDKAAVGGSFPPAGTSSSRCGADGSARDLGSRGRRFETCHRDQTTRALGCGRSSMAEPWAVNPLVPVRLRPVTPKRMPFNASRTRAAEYRALTPDKSGFEPLATHQTTTPSWRNGQTHRSQKPEPQGMSVRLGPRGPTSSPVAQRQSSALIRRRPVDRAHPGPPTTSADPRPSTTKEVCHEADQRRRRELSRSRANGARDSRLRRASSAATALSAARKSSSRSSAATIRAHAAPRSRFKRCCLRSGCF
jgi:hypothetical protein